jgi:hypothetical protein
MQIVIKLFNKIYIIFNTFNKLIKKSESLANLINSDDQNNGILNTYNEIKKN